MIDEKVLPASKDEFRVDSATMRLAAEQSIDGIAFADLDGHIQFVNSSWAKMHGYSVEELIGRHLKTFHDEEQLRREVEPFIEQVMANGSHQGEVGHVDSRGRCYSTWMSVTVVRDKDAAPVGLLAIARDITERKAMETALKSALQQAEQATEQARASSRAKSEFLAIVSHEIRTPMNGILGMSGLMLESELTNEQRSNIETIRVSADNLLSIINEILDFSKIESGQLELECEPFSPRQIIDEVLSLITPIALEKGLEVRSRIDETVPDRVIGDSGRIRQVLMNLAGNAVKFTSEGKVSIQVGGRELEPGKLTLVWTVTDTGIGIPADKLEQIFMPFRQNEAVTTRRHGGTGLGLSIAKKLADAMGGRLELNSSEGEGSEFRLILNHDIAVTDDENQRRGAVECTDGVERLKLLLKSKRIRVLIVEDNRINQRVVLKQLDRDGIHSDVAADGQEALSALSSLPYDLVLMDCQMPVMDGYEATRRIRNGKAGEKNRNIHIIALTANAMAADRDRALEAGMDQYLAKPVKHQVLLGTIASWLEDYSPRRA